MLGLSFISILSSFCFIVVFLKFTLQVYVKLQKIHIKFQLKDDSIQIWLKYCEEKTDIFIIIIFYKLTLTFSLNWHFLINSHLVFSLRHNLLAWSRYLFDHLIFKLHPIKSGAWVLGAGSWVLVSVSWVVVNEYVVCNVKQTQMKQKQILACYIKYIKNSY